VSGDIDVVSIEESPVATAQAPEVIVVTGVSKRFVVRKDNSLKERLVTLGRTGRRHREDFWALRDINLNISAGSTIALIGHNGSGKSTLLKVIGGIIQPTTGSVAQRGRMAALLELGAGFHPDLTGRENVFLNASILGLTREQTEARFDEILAFAGIGDFIDTQVKFYSSGMYVRLAFAVAVHTDPDILLVDEVLSVGDEAFQRKCLDKIRSFQNEGRTIILVTHSLGQVTDLADHAVLLNHGEVIFSGAPYEAVAMFRDVLEEGRLAERAAAGIADEPASIVSVTAHAAGKAIGEDVAIGDDLIVRITFEHREGISEWLAALQINSSAGQVVYGTANLRQNIVLKPLKGRRTVEFRLRDVHLGTGKYFVNASLLDSSARHLADLPLACSFNIAYMPEAQGTVYMEPVITELDSDIAPN
jgi:ABC-2 type transport system ATP-binding protein